MNGKVGATLVAAACATGVVFAQGGGEEEAYVRIDAPRAGETLSSTAAHQLVYEVQPGPRGDHVHVYVDDQEVGILRALEGSYELASLSPGMHEICVKVVNRGHVPIGVDGCVTANVQ
jgi:hypothetical protein